MAPRWQCGLSSSHWTLTVSWYWVLSGAMSIVQSETGRAADLLAGRLVMAMMHVCWPASTRKDAQIRVKQRWLFSLSYSAPIKGFGHIYMGDTIAWTKQGVCNLSASSLGLHQDLTKCLDAQSSIGEQYPEHARPWAFTCGYAVLHHFNDTSRLPG